MRRISIVALLILSAFSLYSQEVFRTNATSKIIKTLQVRVAGEEFSDPCIPLNGNRQIEINFDALEDGFHNYTYTVVHCDADWKQSTLSSIEYLNGFPGQLINDFANSSATTTSYTNYRLFLPNEDIQLKVSGNYVVKVFSEDKPTETVFTACFSVVEPLVDIAATITGNTLIDTNHSHQQINFSVNHKNFPIPYPLTDLKIWVYQNNRRDNAVTGIVPMNIFREQIEYANIRELIFDAGNEYRRFEFLSKSYAGINVAEISFHNPYYHVTLLDDQIRNGVPYTYDQDQDGRLFVRCSPCNDPDSEADYFIVHFTLPSDFYTDGDIYLSGELFNNVLDGKSKMEYNRERGEYEKSVLLKQGHYNYQYLFVPKGKKQGLTSVIEGDNFQTENEYSIYIYYRPMGERYDRLIGMRSMQNDIPVF